MRSFDAIVMENVMLEPSETSKGITFEWVVCMVFTITISPAWIVHSPVSSPITTPVTTDVDSDSEEQVVATDIPLGAVIKPIAIPMTTVTKRTRSDRVMEEEVPLKRQAVSHEGKILDIGTPKRCTRLLVFKKMVSIDGDQYLVAYPDKIDQLKMMTN